MAQKTNKLPKIVYTHEEENWLVTNVLEFRDIIENKKTDGATKLDKERAWKKITKAFNVAPPNQVNQYSFVIGHIISTFIRISGKKFKVIARKISKNKTNLKKSRLLFFKRCQTNWWWASKTRTSTIERTNAGIV